MISKFKFFTRFALCFTVLFSALGIQKALATHFAAVDLWLEFDKNKKLAGDSTHLLYTVYLQVYKACEGVGAGQADLGTVETVTFSSVNSGQNFSRSFQITNLHNPPYSYPPANHGPLDTLDQLCGNISPINLCRAPASVSIYPAFVRATYIDTVSLPTRATDWKIVWTNGARNAAIANLTPNQGNIWCEAGINNLESGHWFTSTPHLLSDPYPFFCVNQPNLFPNTPFDPDLDSMRTFSNIPQNAGGTNFGYVAPYTIANPIGALTPPGYNVNPSTGLATFTPPTTGRFVLAFRTYKYLRDGAANVPHVVLGYCSRDVQVSILTCSSAPPSIDSMPTNLVNATYFPGTNGTIISICPGVPMSFQVHSNSNNPIANLLLTANNGVSCPGSVFTTATAPGSITGTFTWTPSATDIGDHVVQFDAKDSTCNNNQPLVLRNYLVMIVRVLPGLDAGPDAYVCPLNDRPYQMHVSGPSTSVYQWEALGGGPAPYLSCTVCPNPIASPPVTTTYVVFSNDPIFVCKSRDTITINVDNSNWVEANPSPFSNPMTVCRPRYDSLHAQGMGPAPVQNLPCGTANPQTCNIPDSVIIGTGLSAAPNTTNTPFLTAGRYHKYQFILPKQELLAAGFYSGTIQSISFRSIAQALGVNPLSNLRISLKCTNRTAWAVGSGNTDFETGATQVATVASYTIQPNAWNQINLSIPYSWDTSQNLLVDICMGPMLPDTNFNGYDPVATMPGSAIQRFDNTVDVCGAAAPQVNVYAQRPVVKFHYCPPPALPFTYYWSPGTYLDDSTVQNPYAYIPRSMTYFVYTKGRNGCLIRDSLEIVVPVHTLHMSPKDTSICIGDRVQLHTSATSTLGTITYQWYENGNPNAPSLSCNTCTDPFAVPTQGLTTYSVVFTDNLGCLDTQSITVHAWPLPVVNILNRDTTIKYGGHLNLMVTGAYQYTWSPSGSLTDPNIPNPIASPTEPTQYIVYGSDRHHCQSTDTIRVGVDYRDNLMIPSGFTPNGDGKNDIFKVVNLTFQKIMEFRVFNRWGQEIYSTTDGTKGWDGTWKGVPQDVGTYPYLIRVSYPDGYVETYKGNVILIR